MSTKTKGDGNHPMVQFVVRFSDDCPPEKRHEIAAECGLGEGCEAADVVNGSYSVYRMANVEDSKAVLGTLKKHKYIQRGAEAVSLDNITTFSTDRLVADFDASVTQADRDAVTKLLGSEKGVKVSRDFDGCLTLQVKDDKDDIEEVASALQDRIRRAGYVKVSVRNDPVILYSPLQFGKRDAPPQSSFEDSQPALELIDAYRARDLFGDEPPVRVAIIDSGFDNEHPDLKGVESVWYNPFTRDGTAKPLQGDGHGTACAGIVVAPDNNRGVLGIAAGCKLIGIRFVNKVVPSQSGIQRWELAPQEIGDAINHAWRELKADVISLSWGWSQFLNPMHNPILEAIFAAVKEGRDGKGCVVVASSGNEGADLPSFPASMRTVMAVAACDTKGVPKRRDPSAEGGDWGSNKGDTLSVAAPGLEVMTTDVHGNDGYKPGDYVAFKGTSAAAPIVAGVAGLVLRANPGLSAAQVREIIESTAKKTGTEAMQPARYNAKGYSDEMGFGCVNAYEAVKLAKVTPPA